MESTLGVKYDVMFTPPIQIFEHLRKRSADIAWSICNRLVRKKNEQQMLVSYGNVRPLLIFLKARGRWGHVFDTSASPRP